MNTFLDTLLLEVSLRPDLGRLLSAALLSSGMILGAALICRLLRQRSASARSLIWRSVMLGLLLLAYWQFLPRSEPPMTLHVELTAPVLRPLPMPEITPVILPSLPPPAWWERALSRMDKHAHRLWLIGALALLTLKVTRQIIGLRQLMRRSSLASASVNAACHSIAKCLGIKKNVTCHLVPGLDTPLLTGLFQAHVWLPAEAESWTESRCHAVFHHELAHLKRHDLSWQRLTMLVASLWWWNPLFNIATRALHAEAEKAADDLAVLRSGDSHGYARTLVEIAAGWSSGASTVPTAGLAMFGSRENLQHRVHELLRENHWRGRIGYTAMLVIAVVGLFLLSLASTRLEFQPRRPTYQSLAKLVAGGRIIANEGNVRWQEQMNDFYGTIIETLESAEMKKRALARVHALHPDLKDSDVDIRVAQTKGSAIFNVFAVGGEPQFTRIFLDALLDEFIAFRQQIREQGLERALNTFTETFVKKSKELQERTVALETFRKAHAAGELQNQKEDASLDLKTAKERVRQVEQRLADLEIMATAPDNALANFERGLSADGSLKMGASPGLTLSEQSFLRAKAESFSLSQELSFLKKTPSANPAAILDFETKVAKANHVASAWLSTIRADCEREIGTLTRQLQTLKAERNQIQKDALETNALLAEEERLEEEFKAAKLMHEEMFKKVQNFQDFQNLQTDYIAIQERATHAYLDQENRGIQVWKLWSKAQPSAAQ